MPETTPSSAFDRIRHMPRWAFVTSGIAAAAIIGGSIYYGHLSANPNTPETVQPSQEVTNTMELLQSDRIHLPGAQLTDAGLRVEPMPFAIVNQDGSGGQPNQPINLYGAHLEASSDFTVKAKMEDVTGKASLSLYGDVPVIYDEFRYERNTLELDVSGSSLTVQTWKNNAQQPQSTTYAIPNGEVKDLSVTKRGNRLLISVADQQVADLPADQLFSSGKVWFGASAAGQPWTLRSLTAVKENGQPLEVVDSTDPNIKTVDQEGLQYLLNQTNKRPGFTIGAAVALAPLVSDPQYAGIVLGGNFGGITTENTLKWQFAHPAPDTYDFKEADALVALAGRYHLKVHGHTLVFGEANPAWVQNLPTATEADKARVEQAMTEHIRTTMTHFAGKIATWDVVNEPLADYDQFEAGQKLRSTKWSQAMGEGFITKAFHAAHAADPTAKLYINEFGLEEDGERWDYFLDMVTRLKQAGVPIDGVGFQAHVYERDDRINPKTLRKHMEQLARIGIDSRVSENDVYSDDGPKTQAKEYASTFTACLQTPSCTSYTTWGVSDRYNKFRDDDGSIQDGQDFLWDKDMRPTRAVDAIRKVIVSK